MTNSTKLEFSVGSFVLIDLIVVAGFALKSSTGRLWAGLTYPLTVYF